jgi:putative transposase
VLNLLRSLVFAALALFRTRRQLAVETLALRHQLGVLRRSVKRPRLTNADRGLWVLLSRRWSGWSDALIVVKPATVVKWHRAGFRRYWTWRSRPKGGRPGIDPEIRKLIKRMGTANLWGAPRIHGELLKLGIDISQATVSKYLPFPRTSSLPMGRRAPRTGRFVGTPRCGTDWPQRPLGHTARAERTHLGPGPGPA